MRTDVLTKAEVFLDELVLLVLGLRCRRLWITGDGVRVIVHLRFGKELGLRQVQLYVFEVLIHWCAVFLVEVSKWR